jgi:hypothetical protein
MLSSWKCIAWPNPEPMWSRSRSILKYVLWRSNERCNPEKLLSVDNAPPYGAKYPEMSRIKCAGLEPKALTDPLVVGTIAMFDVTEPSMAFNVDTSG